MVWKCDYCGEFGEASKDFIVRWLCDDNGHRAFEIVHNNETCGRTLAPSTMWNHLNQMRVGECGFHHSHDIAFCVASSTYELGDVEGLLDVVTRIAQGDKAVSVTDDINQPAHYTFSDIEPLKVIEAWGLCYHLGQVIKYVSRHAHKEDALKDLKKARFYLDRKIELMEQGQ